MLTAEQAWRLFDYDPCTGVLTWYNDKGRAKAGDRVGCSMGKENPLRHRTRVDGEAYMIHRIVWLYMTGNWPVGVIDHINGNPYDNSWANLRDVSTEVNRQNQRSARADSTTKIQGVGLACRGKKYRARITVGGKQKLLGVFADAAEAHAAYLTAKRALHEGCTL